MLNKDQHSRFISVADDALRIMSAEQRKTYFKVITCVYCVICGNGVREGHTVNCAGAAMDRSVKPKLINRRVQHKA